MIGKINFCDILFIFIKKFIKRYMIGIAYVNQRLKIRHTSPVFPCWYRLSCYAEFLTEFFLCHIRFCTCLFYHFCYCHLHHRNIKILDYIIRTNRLCKKYKETTALNHVSLNIPQGAVYGLIGNNGVGKTTLMRILANLQVPTSGSVQKMRGIREGTVIETPALYPLLSARGNLKYQMLLRAIRIFWSWMSRSMVWTRRE